MALAHAREAGDPEWEAATLGGLADAFYAQGRMRSALASFEPSVALAEQHGLGRVLIHRMMIGICQRYLNQLDVAMENITAAGDTADRIGQPRGRMLTRMQLAETQMERAEYAPAAALMEDAVAIAKSLGNDRFRAYFLHDLARARWGEGDGAAADELLAEALALSEATDPAFVGARIHGVRALVASSDDARVAALAAGLAIVETGRPIAHNHLVFYRDAIEASLAGGNLDDAGLHADRLETFAAAEPLPWATLFAGRGRAIAALTRDPLDVDARRALEAVRIEVADTGFAAWLPAVDVALAGAAIADTA